MWSDKYNYYNIQSDRLFTQKIDIETVVNVLLQTSCLKQKSRQTFSNTESFPWVDITIADTKDGNFSTSDKEIHFVRLISIVCSKGKNINQTIYTDVFLEIAKTLNWKLYLEDNDDDIEIKQE